MSIIRIENFGGEAPSASARSLPLSMARTSKNLLATINEFRPLGVDEAVGTPIIAGAKTLYRMARAADGAFIASPSAGWITHSGARNYVKGQIDDDRTERTYYTAEDGSAKPRVVDAKGVDRLMGVPAPTGNTEATVNQSHAFTQEEADAWVAVELVPALVGIGYAAVQDTGPRMHVKVDSTPVAGAYSKHGLQWINEAGRTGETDYWNLRTTVSASVAAATGLNDPRLGAFEHFGTLVTPITCNPYWGVVVDVAAAKTSLRAIMNPVTGSQLLSEPLVLELADWLVARFNPDSVDLKTIRAALDDVVRQYAATWSAAVAGDAAPTAPTVPTTPTVREYDATGERSTEWKAYDIVLAAYKLARESFERGTAKVGATQTATISALVALQAQALRLTHEIEARYYALRDTMDAHFKQWQQDRGFDFNTDSNETVNQVGIAPAALTSYRAYLTTFVNGWGEESSPSQPSAVLTLDQYSTVTISRPPVPEGWGIAGWRIYRSNTGTSSTEYQLLTDVTLLEGGAEVSPSLTPTQAVTSVYTAMGRVGALAPTQGEIDWWVNSQAQSGVSNTRLRVEMLRAAVMYEGHALYGPAALVARSLLAEAQNHTTGAFDFFALSLAAYTDETGDGELAEVLPTLTWLPPPSNLAGLTGMANGVMAGYFDNTLCFCEPYVPYAWPIEYQPTVKFPIVGMAAYGQTLFVGTRGSPYLVSGADSASMSLQELPGNQACVSARSIAAVENGVLYASPDGICLASSNGVQLVTQGLFTKSDWESLSPSGIVAAVHDNAYYFCFADGTCYALDFVSKKLTQVVLGAALSALYADTVTDTLYAVKGNSIVSLFTGASARVGLYRTGIVILAKQEPFAWVRVESDFTAPVTVRWYADGSLRKATVLTTVEPVRLPAGRYREHEFEIESTARVTRVTVAGNTLELQSA